MTHPPPHSESFDDIAAKHLPALLIGFFLGGLCVVIAFSAGRPVAAPLLRPPTAIRVTLYPSEIVGEVDGKPVTIPPEMLDLAFRLLTPQTYFKGGANEKITPIVGKAVITHADGTETYVWVRDHGHNPAVVTIDGRNYFYARNDPDVLAGAYQFVGLVMKAACADRKNSDSN
jgi:hypothetical protein